MPDKVINLPFSITGTQFRPPAWHWNPGATINVHDTRPHRDPDRRPFGKNYRAFVLSGMGDVSSERDVAEINPPVYRGDGEAYYAITFSIGSTGANRYFDYLYEWVPGAPTEEELAESEVKDTVAKPEFSTTESGALVSFSKRDVKVKIQGIWNDVDSGKTIPPGAKLKLSEDEIERRRQQAESLERSPQRSRHAWLKEVPEMVRDEPHQGLNFYTGFDGLCKGGWNNLAPAC